MSRLTDTERGARIAQDVALWNLQPQLFGSDPVIDQLWHGIFVAALDQLVDCRYMRQAMAA